MSETYEIEIRRSNPMFSVLFEDRINNTQFMDAAEFKTLEENKFIGLFHKIIGACCIEQNMMPAGIRPVFVGAMKMGDKQGNGIVARAYLVFDDPTAAVLFKLRWM